MLRLRSRAQFQAVLAGDRLAVTAHFVLHRFELPGPFGLGPPGTSERMLLFKPVAFWIGAMVPKRWAKRAVMRNAMKRQIYNVSLQFEDDLPVAAYLVRLRAGFDSRLYISAASVALKQSVRRELLMLFAAGCSARALKPA
ncbi:MAG: ribonuclease P protein component [Burkholderiaceae bacterium]